MSNIILNNIASVPAFSPIDDVELGNVKASVSEQEVVTTSRKEKSADHTATTRRVALDTPNAAVNGAPTSPSALKNLESLSQLVQSSSERLGNLPEQTAALAARLVATSVADFEVELSKTMDEVQQTQNKRQIEEVKQAREKNKTEIIENEKKIQESAESAKEAKKSGLFAKIFGWISAIASIVIGAIMVATGVGAAAGALMIAGGVMGVVTQAVQQAAADGLISPEVMKVLGPVLTAIEAAFAVISAVVTFGGAAADKLGKLGAMIGKLVATEGPKAAANGAKLGTQIANTVVSVSGGVTNATNSAYQAKAITAQAQVSESNARLTENQAIIDKLKEELGKMNEDFQEIFTMIMRMLYAKNDSLEAILSRPATA